MRSATRGFSLIEMMVVVAITLVVAVVTIPNAMSGVAAVRLRSSASTLAGTLQEARMLAVRDNRAYPVRSVTVNSEIYAFIDIDNDSVLDNGEERRTATLMPASLGMVTSGAPSAMPAVASFGTPTVALPSFNSRGLPCSGSPCANGSFIIYLRQDRPFGATGWGAVTVTQAGRIRSWTWNGTAWN